MSEQNKGRAYHRRKANQAWECAGCARQDRDKADEQRWTEEAHKHERLAAEATS